MEIVKETNEYTIVKKRSGRYGVRGAGKKWINGADKIQILVQEGLIKAAVPSKEVQEAEAAAKAEAEAAAEASEEAAAE